MHKQKQLQYAVIGVLGFALLFMTVGFAAYAQLVGGDSAAAIDKKVTAIHKVGFDANSYLESDRSVAASEKSITSDGANLTIKLEKPGDSYAAMLNIVNNGNVDETLTEIKMTPLDEKIAKAIDYRISFEDEDYIGTSYNVDTTIGRGEANRKQLFINVEYKEDATNLGPLNLDLYAGLVFESAD